MIKGAGEILLTLKPAVVDAFADFYWPPCYATFTMVSETDLKQAQYLSLVGVTQTFSHKIQAEKYFIELEFEDVDWTNLQMIFGEIAGAAEDVQIYEELEICPLTSVTVDDDRITAELVSSFSAYNMTDKIFMTQADQAVNVVNNTFHVDPILERFTFASEQLGQAIHIKIPIVKDALACLGGINARGEIYDIGFQGRFFTTSGDGPYHILVPDIRRVSAPSFIASGDTVKVRMRYQAVCADPDLLVGEDIFERKPFRIYSPTSGIPIATFNLQTEDGFNILLEDGSNMLTEE